MQNSLHHNFIDNPIMRRENLTLNRQRGKWFWRIMFALTTLLILIPVFWGFSRHFYDSIGVAASFLVIANIVIYPMVIIRAITTTNDSTNLEHRGKTWDLLMLTGISNWRLVLGKWLGVMCFTKRDFIWLYIVRVATLLWFNISMNLVQDYDYNRLRYYWNGSNDLVNLFNIRIGSEFLLLALTMVLVFTILELMLSSAIGLAFSFFKWKSRTGSSVAIGVRVALAVGIPMLIFMSLSYADGDFFNGFREYEDNVVIFMMRSSTMLIDNGMMSAGYLLDPYSSNMDRYFGEMIIAHMIGLSMYIGFTILALQLAVNRASARGANFADMNPMKMKPKRKAKIQPNLASSATQSDVAQPMNMKQDTANIFNLSNAENRTVEVYHYQRRLGRMYLRITGDGEPIYILLSSVAYIEAPSFWKGANFRTASQAEYEFFVQQKHIRVNGLAADTMRLYQSDKVRIIAGNAQILDELPMNI